MMQNRYKYLSRFQRVMSLCLHRELAAEKIFDRFQPVGLCLNYSTTLDVLGEMADNCRSYIVKSVKDGKKPILYGDNINLKTGVHDQRSDNTGLMDHWFGSVVVIHNIDFSTMVSDNTQSKVVQVKDILPDERDMSLLKRDYVFHMSKVVQRHLPAFSFLKDIFPRNLTAVNHDMLQKKTLTVPLPAKKLNEQYYADVVEILKGYEDTIHEVYNKAGVELTDDTKIQIGGDQLTRERFSGAKVLRAGSHTVCDRFDHLGPITFGFFHMMMNLIQVYFDILYNVAEGGSKDIGTMRCEQNRIHRTQVKRAVKDEYDADRDFVVCYTDAHIVAAVMEHFEMQNFDDQPNCSIPTEDRQKWVFQKFSDILQKYMNLPKVGASSKTDIERNNGAGNMMETPPTGRILNVTLSNGKPLYIPFLDMKTAPPTSSSSSAKKNA